MHTIAVTLIYAAVVLRGLVAWTICSSPAGVLLLALYGLLLTIRPCSPAYAWRLNNPGTWGIRLAPPARLPAGNGLCCCTCWSRSAWCSGCCFNQVVQDFLCPAVSAAQPAGGSLFRPAPWVPVHRPVHAGHGRPAYWPAEESPSFRPGHARELQGGLCFADRRLCAPGERAESASGRNQQPICRASESHRTCRIMPIRSKKLAVAQERNRLAASCTIRSPRPSLA